MGVRGPKPGTKYHKRVTIAPPVPIRSDGQLREAQRFNDHIENVMERLEENRFPFDHLNPRLISRFREYTEAIQDAVLAGIEHYETHPTKPTTHTDDDFALGAGSTLTLGEE